MAPSHKEAIDNFREYLRRPAIHPDPDYGPSVEFVKDKAEQYGFKTKVIHLSVKKPVLIITMEGIEPNLPSILLNSHMDVVPVFEKEWKHDPFGAEMDDKGNIYARGAQDMKCVTIAQLEALKRIKSSNVKLKRTVHMTVAPDEEIGSVEGMEKFVHTQAFKDLNVCFDIDEGIPFYDEEFLVFKNDRTKWAITIHCPGTTGHGSLFLKDTAGEKIQSVINSFMDFRQKEAEKLKDMLYIGDTITVNMTQLGGGVQNNVVPPELVVGFDMRISPDRNHEEIENWINEVCKKAGEGVFAEYTQKDPKVSETLLTDNPFWEEMQTTFKILDLKYYKITCSGATDARFVRRFGIPAVGFSPFNKTELLIHGNDEYMNKDIFLKGISIYEKFIQNVANV